MILEFIMPAYPTAKVLEYNKDSGQALVLLENGILRIGNQIEIVGESGSTYRQELTSILLDKKPLYEVTSGSRVLIKLDKAPKINTSVSKIVGE